MRLLTKAEACRELRMSLSTLNRVYVILDDDPPGNGVAADPALAMERERIRDLEGQVELLQGQLEMERQRNVGLVNELKAAQERRGPWWRFWQS